MVHESQGPHKSTLIEQTVKGAIAGGVTGAIEICITFPTEYVKTQLQLDERMGSARQYSGPIDCVKKTVGSYGFRGLYRGLPVLLYGSVPKSAVRFGAFEEFKRHNLSPDGTLTAGRKLLCGLGITGMYKGVTPTILKQGSNQAIRFFVMETLKDGYRQYRGDKTTGLPVPKLLTGLFGIIAGAASVYGNTPLDVVKTRMQGLDAHKYKNTLHCAWKIWTEEGFFAFYKGTVPRLGRVCLDVCISFMIYDSFMESFHKVWDTKKS